MLRLPRSGAKADIIQRLLSSQYELSEVLQLANEINLANQIYDYLKKEELQERLQVNKLPISGSRKELLLRLIANRVFDTQALLEELSPEQLAELYFSIYNRVPTTPKERVIEQILQASGPSSVGVSQKDTIKVSGQQSKFKWDIALSFAGEDRQIAKEIFDKLSAANVRVFYDKHYQAELWGKNLSDEFQQQYGPNTRFVLLLISQHYAIKDWTDFEFTIARAEARHRKQEFILPVQLDNTPLVGLKSTIAHLDLEKMSVDGVVTTVLKKLDRIKEITPNIQKPSRFEERQKGLARLEFFFRRFGARNERFQISWANPETLHQVEINAEIQYKGKGKLREALVKLVIDERLITGPSTPSISFRTLRVLLNGKIVPVKFAQLPWRGHKGLSLFKSAPQRLFKTDLSIFFKKEWVDSKSPPFIYWELHAPDQVSSTGFILVKRDEEDIILVPTSIPEIKDFQQNGHNRSFLTRPDLSFGPDES